MVTEVTSKRKGKLTRVIALEEHFSTPALMQMNRKLFEPLTKFHGAHPSVASYDELAGKLTDLGEGRISNMDHAGIDMQVLSLTSPGTDQMEPADALNFARSSNDFVAGAVERFPSRLAAFASLPTSSPEKAADELERTVKQFGFKGAVINGHCRGRYLDDRFFWPIFERAESLSVPVYLHPTIPPQPIVNTYYAGKFEADLTYRLSSAAWGWHIETATHVLRLILGGVFDEYPKLQLIIGHLGEALPFMMERLEQNLPAALTNLKHPFGAYLRENINYTISGFNFTPVFLNLFLEVGAERIMFSADYPYSSMEEARDFLEHMPVSSDDRERIAHGNAERLMHI